MTLYMLKKLKKSLLIAWTPECQKFWWVQVYMVGLICPQLVRIGLKGQTLGWDQFSPTLHVPVRPSGPTVRRAAEMRFGRSSITNLM